MEMVRDGLIGRPLNQRTSLAFGSITLTATGSAVVDHAATAAPGPAVESIETVDPRGCGWLRSSVRSMGAERAEASSAADEMPSPASATTAKPNRPARRRMTVLRPAAYLIWIIVRTGLKGCGRSLRSSRAGNSDRRVRAESRNPNAAG